MTTYEIEQLIVLIEKHRVEARTVAEAIVKLFDGDTELMDISLADLCDERGLPAEDFPALVEELRKLGIMTNETVIPSIMSVEEVSGVRVSIPTDAQVEIHFAKAE
jgi:hypothetical protein